MPQNTMTPINSDTLINLLAEGNIYVWILFLFFLLVMFMLAWIKFEPSIRSLFMFIFSINSNDEKLEKEKEKNALNIKANLFFDKISMCIVRLRNLSLSKDPGRNLFYHFLIEEIYQRMFNDFKSCYEDFLKGKVSEEMFCSYYKFHSIKLQESLNGIENFISKKLQEKEKWDKDLVDYTIKMFRTWKSYHTNLLIELVSSSKTPSEIIMALWVFYYEIYISVEKFGVLFNGKLTGAYFDSVKIGKVK